MIYTLIFLGIVSYTVFLLGIFHILFLPVLTLFGIVTCIIVVYIFVKREWPMFKGISEECKKNKLIVVYVSLLCVQVFVNFIGVLGPEIGFDALWYHLALPKIYIENHAIFHIPGGLLYYSDMPKLGEMLYILGLSFGSEIYPKMIHFSFGILCVIGIYKTLRLFVSPVLSLCGGLIFYTSLVVGWESTSAYIDLIRTCYEIMALYTFLIWTKTQSDQFLWCCAVLVGFAVTSKLLALGSVVLFICLIICSLLGKESIVLISKKVFAFLLIALLVPLPWFIFALTNTGNPFYPFFSSIYPVSFSLLLFSPITLIKELINLFLLSSDPISPLFIIFLPLLIFYFKKFSNQEKYTVLYALLALCIWYITPRTGGGRFILPYLPGWSLLVVFVLQYIHEKKAWYRLSVILIFVAVCISIGYRAVANSKYIPYILGKESKTAFLQNHLNFSYGDFYDIDGYFGRSLTKKDKVLLYGFHNTFYINFPFIHHTYVKKGDTFNYIATQNSSLPAEYTSWEKLYTNTTTHVNLYTNKKVMQIYDH